MKTQHCIMDLRELIRLLNERQARNIQAVKDSDHELTAMESARFEVGFGLLCDLLRDLKGIADAWDNGQPHYRVTEQMLEKEASL